MSKAKIDRRRQNWMLSLSNNVKSLGGHGGQIDWSLATYLYNEGIGSVSAAFKIVEAQKKDQTN